MVAVSCISGKEDEYLMVLAIREVSQTLFNATNPQMATPPNAGNFVFTSSTSLFNTPSNLLKLPPM
jgi:hypothetical protein